MTKPNPIQPHPSTLQNIASDPTSDIWVSASAGTGKTKVLTDRVLRLLLPRMQEGKIIFGCAPHKILCLTFTKAAAAEMKNRIHKTLRLWVMADHIALKDDLEDLLGHIPTDQQITTARHLFYDVIDHPIGLRIMTLHAFCQSILRRFPIEANIPSHFEAIDDHQASILRQKALDQILDQAGRQQQGKHWHALLNLIPAIPNETLKSVVKDYQFNYHNLKNKTIDQDQIISNKEEFVENNLKTYSTKWFEKLIEAIQDLPPSSRIDKFKQNLELCYKVQQTDNLWNAYRTALSAFFTKNGDGEISQHNYTKIFPDQFPDLCDAFNNFLHTIQSIRDQLIYSDMMEHTQAVQILSEAVLKTYKEFKEDTNSLDFDDLILTTRNLLISHNSSSQWVMFKLDGGIDHILVDEAQDTNPIQWEIIQALSENFYQDAEKTNRSLFVVGDEKQSIYSFQHADPKVFADMHHRFAKRAHTAKKNWQTIDLTTSFRCRPKILQMVDTSFAESNVKKGVVYDPDQVIHHEAFHTIDPSLVTVWPCFSKSDDPKPNDLKEAELIANKIKSWLHPNYIHPALNRTVEPRDIMILMRKRNRFFYTLLHVLKRQNIPLAGVDRLKLTKSVICQDILALLSFVLLPNDDLSLAGLLKSPFIGFDDQDLYQITDQQKGSLWHHFSHIAETKPVDHPYRLARDYLDRALNRADYYRPYDFIAHVFNTPCLTHDHTGRQAYFERVGSESQDVIDELLNLCLQFEQTQIASLQNFLLWFEQIEIEIKREIDSDQANCIQMMTVHGSKGLQSPIVILADTAGDPNRSEGGHHDILMSHKQPEWFFIASKKYLPQSLEVLLENKKDLSLQEHRRLLYVAMTRAEQALYISGHTGQKAPHDQSWYKTLSNGIDQCDPNIEETDLGITRHLIGHSDKKPKTEEKTEIPYQAMSVPVFMFEPHKPDHKVSKTFNPSALDDQIDHSQVEKTKQKEDITTRQIIGITIHKILQLLPKTDPEFYDQIIEYAIVRYSQHLYEVDHQRIKSDMHSLISNSDFADIIAKDGFTELPIVGKARISNTKTEIISGQIDRVLIKDKVVKIIDYKTSLNPPKNIEDIPGSYKQQLTAYRDVMQQLYPDHKIMCYLLWTSTLDLMEIPDQLLGYDL